MSVHGVDCRCACVDSPMAYRQLSTGVFGCVTGTNRSLRFLCLPAGPGLGHEIMRSLPDVLAGLGGCVALVDYPGHGRSRSVNTMAGLISALADCVDDETVLVGHSWGAALAASITAERLPAALILLNPPPDRQPPPHERWSGTATAAVAAARTVSTATTGAYERYLRSFAMPNGFDGDRPQSDALMNGVRLWEEAWRRQRSFVLDPFWRTKVLSCAAVRSVLVIHGQHDRLFDTTLAASADRTPGVQQVVLPTGHYGYYEQPDQLRAVVRAFLCKTGDSDAC